MVEEILLATGQTLYMVLLSSFVATLFGLPLGILLFIWRPQSMLPKKALYHFLSIIINVGRSLPFIILLIAVLPFTRFIIGTTIGTNAAIVPLTLGAIPFIARLIENTFCELPHGLIEAGQSLGAKNSQIIFYFLFPEALPAIIQELTVVIISLVGYSAMAGTVGGGGLGDLAIRYGYQRFDTQIMLITIIILICLVQACQFAGDFVAALLRKK